MDRSIRYTVFKISHGWFGLLGDQNGLIRSCLPVSSREKAQEVLLSGITGAKLDNNGFGGLVSDVKTYYKGTYVDFCDVKVNLEGMSEFAQAILSACRKVTYGNTVSYGRLAELAERPEAARAVGGALGRNPIPLIIPCHRIIRSDGSMGGFSAAGGIGQKQRMLRLETAHSLKKQWLIPGN